MNRMKKPLSLLLSLMLLLMCLPTANAANEPKKEEVIYAALKPNGQAEEAYVVNIFPGGAVTDYGDYTSVRMMNTEDAVTYSYGLVSFVSGESRVYYQGNMDHVELPWLFGVSWTLNGQSMTAEQMAGATGSMEMRFSIRQNPDCGGNFFDTHALQITASLDTDRCANITAEGATQANVGSVRQLNWIILPGTESDVLLTADVKDFEMPALSINGVRMQLDPGEEVIEDVLALVDGLEELSSHNAELTEGTEQLVQAALDTANAELQARKADFDMLGITLNTLTLENYDEEITRLQEELLEKVDDYVLEQAERQLIAQVNSAAAGMVRAEVEKAARAQVEQEVRKAAQAQVREAVTAEARKQVEAALRNPADADMEALVETQMQTDEVQAMIDEIVEVQMASPEVQAQINAGIEAIARPQVEAAVEAEVRRQVEAAVRQALRGGIEKAMEAQIRAEVIRELGSPDLPSITPEDPDLLDPLDPSVLPTLPTLPTDETVELPSIQDILDGLENSEGPQLPSLDPSLLPTLPKDETVELPSVQDILDGLENSEGTLLPSLDPSVLPTIPVPTEASAADAISEPTDAPSASTDESTELPSIQDILDGLGNPGTIVIPFADASALPTISPTLNSAPQTSVTTDTNQIYFLSHTTAADDYCLSPQVEAEVAARMASAEVQQQIEAQTDAAFSSEATQAMIDAQVSARMQSPEVQAIITAEIAAQVANPDNRAQAEAEAREEVRSQVEAVVREQVRAAVEIKLSTMTEEELNALVEEQLQSAAVQQRIEDETASQMQSAEVQAMIDAELENQMKSDEVKALIDAECAKQMQSSAVQSQISSQIATHRNSAAFLDAVAQALEENGENGEAYQALVKLRETLDDLMDYYNGLMDYTNGVEEAATGVSEARTEVKAMLGDGEDDTTRDTISFTSEKNGQVKSVQFVLTIPAIEKPEEPAAEQDDAAEETFIDKLLDLFR